MRKYPIAIATADLHFHNFKAFNEGDSRLRWTTQALSYILSSAKELNVPVLFSGDMIHNPDAVENNVLENLLTAIKPFRKLVKMYGVSGNHDMSQKNPKNGQSPSYIKSLSLMGLMNMAWDGDGHVLDNMFVYGFDYRDQNADLVLAINRFEENHKKFLQRVKKLRILLLHTDIPGARTPSGIELNEAKHFPKHLDEFFKSWDLVLCGHIHRPQQLSNKVYMLGSPIQQTMGDMGIEMGYWVVYSDKSMEFESLNGKFPEFKLGRVMNRKDYFVTEDTHTAVMEIQEEVGFDIKMDREEMVRRYCELRGVEDQKRIGELINIVNRME